MTHSTYHAVCECGHEVATPERESVCPHCQRLLVFEWGQEPTVLRTEQDYNPPKAKGATA